MNLGDLLIRIGADVATFEALRSNLNTTSDAIEHFAHGAEKMAIILEANVTMPLERAGETLLVFGEDFKAASNALILGTGQMEEGLTALQTSFNTVFGEVDASAKEVGQTMAMLSTRLGLSGEPLEHMTKLLEDLANVTGEQMVPQAQAVVTMFAQWNVETEQQAETMDHFLQVAMASGTSLKGIVDNVNAAGPAFRSLGIGIEDASNLIGNLAKSGVNVEPVLMGITKALNTMSKAGLKDPLEGLQLIQEKIVNAASAGEAFQIGATIFGKGAATIVEALRSGKLSLDDFKGSLDLSENTVEEAADKMKTLEQEFGALKNAVMLALKPISEELIQFLEDAVKNIRPLVAWIADLATSFSSLPAPVKEVAIGAAMFAAALGPILGIVAGVAASIDALTVPLAALSGLLGGPAGLIVLAGLLAAALAAWTFAKAYNEIQALNNRLSQLYDTMERGEVATDGQAEKIKALQGALDSYNKLVSTGGKKLEVSQFDAAGNLRSTEDYIKLLEQAVVKTGAMNQANSKVVGSIKNVNGAMTVTLGNLDNIEQGAKKVDTAHGKWTSNALNAYGKLMEKFSAYKQAEEQLAKLREAAGAKSLPILNLQIADLRRQVYAPTATDADNSMLLYYEEILKLNRASNIATSDATLTSLLDLQSKLKKVGMDTGQAFSLLGITSTADVNRQTSEIEAALARIKGSSIATQTDIERATIAALDKEIAAWRAAGVDIENEVIDRAARLKAAWQTAHMDIGQASALLGVQSEGEVDANLTAINKALSIIRDARTENERTQLDADNAEIASLTKKASMFASVGKQITDDERERLNELTLARQQAMMTTDDAAKLLGLPSQTDLDNQLALVKTAYDKLIVMVGDDEQEANRVRLAELNKMIALYRSAGEQVTSDMLAEFHVRETQAQIAAMDIDAAFKLLNTTSTASAVQSLQLLDAAFKQVAEDAHSTQADLDNALVSKLSGTIATLAKQGKAASDAIITQLDNLKNEIAIKVMNLDDAYKLLGVNSAAALERSYAQAMAALKKINEDANATLVDRTNAQIAANDLLLKLEVTKGQQVDELQQAQNKLAKQRLQEQLNDIQNMYTAFLGVVEQAYGALQTGLTDMITGAKSVGDAFVQMGKVIEKAIVDYVVKNLILTQSNLRSLESGILDFFKGMAGIGKTAAGAAKTGTDLALQGATGATEAATGAADTASGILSGFGSIVSLVGAVSSVINTFISYFQNKRMEGTLNAIEQHTKVIAITMSGMAAPWDTVAEGTNTLMSNIRDLRNYAADFNDWKWTVLHADLVEIMGKGDAIIDLLKHGGGTGSGLSNAGDDLSGAATNLNNATSTASSSWDNMISTAGSSIGNAYTDLSNAATGLTDAVAPLDAAATGLSNASRTINYAATAMVAATGAIGAVAQRTINAVNVLGSQQPAAVAPVPYTPGSRTIVSGSPLGDFLTAPATQNYYATGQPGGGPGGAATVPASILASGVAQQSGTVIPVTITGNNISSQRAADELMSTAVAQLRTLLKV